MKKLIFSACLSVFGFFYAGAQSAWIPKAGDVMTYHVSSSGNDYNFIVTVKTLDKAADNPIVFDWKMTAPVNRAGTIKVGSMAATASNAFFNWFSGGEKILDAETSVFISSDLKKQIEASAKGAVIQIKVNGASMGNEDFILTDDAKEFSFTQNGAQKKIKTYALENKNNGKKVMVYCNAENALIVNMSIGFDIFLDSVSSK